MATCKAWRTTAGSMRSLKLVEDWVVPPPGDVQITVDVKCCGLNFADIFACLGLYSATPQGEFTPGLEFSGVVSSVGARVQSVKVGDRVLGVTRFGGYATRLNIEEYYVRALPEGWTFEEGAAFPAQALTAYYGLVKLGDVKKDDVVLVHSAAGGTGLWATHFAKALGAHVVGTVGDKAKAAELQKLTGLDAAAVIARDPFEKQSQMDVVLAVAANHYTPRVCGKYDVVFDSLMGDWFLPSHTAVAPMGRHVVLGAGSMTPCNGRLGVTDWVRLGSQYLKRGKVDPLNMISENKSVMAFNLIWLYERTDMIGAMFAEVLALAQSVPKPHVGERFGFAEAPKALQRFQSGKTVGKVVLVV